MHKDRKKCQRRHQRRRETPFPPVLLRLSCSEAIGDANEVAKYLFLPP